MRPSSRAFVLLAALAFPLVAQQGTTSPSPAAGDRLLVCNKADHSLSLFAPGERRVVATLPTGRGPHEVAVSPDGSLAVVSDYGDQQPGQTLTVVDLASQQVLRTIELATTAADASGQVRSKALQRPHGVRFVAPASVVVTSESARRLLLVDVAAGKVVRTWTTPQTTMHMVAVSSDLRRAAATSIREGNVVFFDLAGEAVAGTPPIACGEGSEGLAVQPGTGTVWVGNRAANTVSVVDPTTAQVVKTLSTGDFPFRIVFTPDGARALVTCAESGELLVFDAATHERWREISIHADGSELSALPMGVTTDPEGRNAYVTCGRGEFVAVVDLAAGAVKDRWAAGRGCDGIAYARRSTAAPRPPEPLKR